jgi:hypothetical protein
MKRHYIYIAILLFASAVIFNSCKTAKISKLQRNFIPDDVSNVYLGMTLKQLKEARGINNLSVIEGDAVTKVREEYTKDSISLITYQLDKNKILYEIIFEYVPEFKVLDYYKIKYGEMNNGKEWLFTLDKNMKLKIWVYQNRLCIADSKHFNN